MKEEEIKIRKARLQDVEQIYLLGKQIKELQYSEKFEFHDKEELNEFVKEKKENILLVAVKREQIVGFLYARVLTRCAGGWCMLDNIAVAEEYRSKGIGKSLLNGLYDILKKRSVNYVQVLVDAESNKAREFWKKRGFKEKKNFIWAEKILNGFDKQV
jgi:ribosomal protein S18 acetylase RimI-like enzyme